MENTFFILAIFLHHEVVFTESSLLDSAPRATELIKNYGYAVEIHKVTTKDGYILEIHRIPGRIIEKSNGRRKGKVALMLHGLIGSSASFVAIGSNRSLALMLVDRGYDVWLCNNRGNTYSTKHVSKSPFTFEFWNFSWHEMGIYDLPETIDYILSNTNKKNLNLVCYSQGCAVAFIMGSLRPEYNEKIKFSVALSPAVYMGNMKGSLQIASKYTKLIMEFIESVGYFPVVPAIFIIRILIQHFCMSGSYFQDVCILVIYTAIGPGYEQLDMEILDRALTYEPAGSSVKQVGHFGYGYYYPGTFRQYPYGAERNLIEYNSTTPPDYPLEKSNFPVAIYHGSNDFIVQREDVAKLVEKLPNVVDDYLVFEESINHYDMIYGRNIRKLVYDRALATMERYN